MAIAKPVAAVLKMLDESHPKRGGMHAKEPTVPTMRQP